MKAQLLATLENSRNYTLAVADAMPENDYSYRPAGDVWNFGELLNHIAYGIEWWNYNYIQKTATDWNPPADKSTKKETIAYLDQAYAALKAELEKATVSDSIIDGFYSTMNHITHHRGQAVLYLRGQGLAAPEYNY